MYSSRQGPLVIEPFDPSTTLRAPLRSGNYEINALTTLAVAIEAGEPKSLRASDKLSKPAPTRPTNNVFLSS